MLLDQHLSVVFPFLTEAAVSSSLRSHTTKGSATTSVQLARSFASKKKQIARVKAALF
jgi:hypothetical protein